MINKVFKDSASKVGVTGKYRRLYRVDNYTSNGFWLINTKFEPEYIEILKESEQKPDVKKLLDQAKDAVNKLEISDVLKLQGKQITAVLKAENYQTLVNVYYLSLFINAAIRMRVSYKLFQKDKNDPIFVKTDDDFMIGVIMPMRAD